MRKKRLTKGSDLAGNAWEFATIDAARAVYETVQKKPGFLTGNQDLSMGTGFFNNRPTLVFLWGPSVDPEIVKSVALLATLAGGRELAQEMTEQALRQMRLRWRAQRRKRPFGGTLQRHHPHLKIWTDLRD